MTRSEALKCVTQLMADLELDPNYRWTPTDWGSLRSGQRPAAVMTLIHSAKLNRHDPCAYLKNLLTRLPKRKSNAIDELLPHNWKPAITDKT